MRASGNTAREREVVDLTARLEQSQAVTDSSYRRKRRGREGGERGEGEMETSEEGEQDLPTTDSPGIYLNGAYYLTFDL